MTIKNFYDLEVWQAALDFVTDVYRLTQGFPTDERFGLISQLRRSSISITSNIAEGFERFHPKDKIRFYHTARGSLAEIESQLIVSERLGYLGKEPCQSILQTTGKIGRQLNALIRSIDPAD